MQISLDPMFLLQACNTQLLWTTHILPLANETRNWRKWTNLYYACNIHVHVICLTNWEKEGDLNTLNCESDNCLCIITKPNLKIKGKSVNSTIFDGKVLMHRAC